jgi:hypothetical protein
MAEERRGCLVLGNKRARRDVHSETVEEAGPKGS